MRSRPVVLVASPSLDAISGVTTHALSLIASPLQSSFELIHFQVGSEGRAESRPAMLARLAASPFVLAGAILRYGVDIVHLNTSLNPKAFWRDAAYAAVAKLLGARVVLQKHGGSLEQFAKDASPFLVRAALRLADAVAVLSRAEVKSFSAFVPGQAIVLLPNGIDVSLFRKKGSERKNDATLRLIYVGRLAARKGLEEIVEGLALARGRGLAARLTICGGGPLEEALRERVQALGAQEAVEFAGATYGEEKARRLAEADVLLLPSHSEGLPYAVLEGMAASAVPVVTPVGALPDVIEEGVHGLFVPIGDAAAIAVALERLAADRERLARMAGAARRRVSSGYSLERLAFDAGSMYSALLPGRAPKTIL
ncbi:MAG: glycosyltransferase family 4 protein [Clostridia bacterium]